jgi:hypothetical protein
MQIIITDLTRFSNPDIVCIAGINLETNKCIRPLPYITLKKCKELNILPGSKLDGIFSDNSDRGLPHIEDKNYQKLKLLGACSDDEFHQILQNTVSQSISKGFDYTFQEGGKVIPYTNPPLKSIITLKINANQIRIVKDSFNHGKIKLNFKDNDGKKFSYLPITDLGFYNYAMKHFDDFDFPKKINSYLDSQDELYLRVGLSGRYKSGDDRDGYWLQINGIYTFPNYNTEIRSYG